MRNVGATDKPGSFVLADMAEGRRTPLKHARMHEDPSGAPGDEEETLA